jgi:hypothetical protein
MGHTTQGECTGTLKKRPRVCFRVNPGRDAIGGGRWIVAFESVIEGAQHPQNKSTAKKVTRAMQRVLDVVVIDLADGPVAINVLWFGVRLVGVGSFFFFVVVKGQFVGLQQRTFVPPLPVDRMQLVHPAD